MAKADALADAAALIAEVGDRNVKLLAENERLREALLQHRRDLHQYSSRPCPTCRKSAEVLGLKGVPDSCARPESDAAALEEKRGD